MFKPRGVTFEGTKLLLLGKEVVSSLSADYQLSNRVTVDEFCARLVQESSKPTQTLLVPSLRY
jgi:hypothetical protein